MCLAVYIASDKELPLIPWNEAAPQFHVSELANDENQVRTQFTLPYIAYAGSHEGCGCGFFKKGERDRLAVQANYDALVHYLSAQMLKGAKLALFACWEGDQDAPREYSETVPVTKIALPGFEFREKAYYEIA